MELHQETYLKFGPYQEILAGIHTALTVNEGIIKVVGEEGSGKSSLCRRLISELDAENREVIFFATPPESSDYLYRRIQSQLGLDKNKNFNRSLTAYLMAKSPPNNKLVIVYDDAEKIDKEIFILIRLLNNIHNQSETLVSQIICGTGELDRRFDDPDLRSLTQYLNQSFSLPAMTRAELDDFCSGYLKQITTTASGISEKELDAIYKASKGYPGKSLEMIQALVKERFPEQKPASVASSGQAASAAPETPAEAGTGSPSQATPAAAGIEAGTTGDYLAEVDAILNEAGYETEPPPSSLHLWFKVAVTAFVLVAAVLLAFLLSDKDRPTIFDNPVEEILADDSPVYLDEVEQDAGTELSEAEEPNLPTAIVTAEPAQNEEEVSAGDEPPPSDTAQATVAVTPEIQAGGPEGDTGGPEKTEPVVLAENSREPERTIAAAAEVTAVSAETETDEIQGDGHGSGALTEETPAPEVEVAAEEPTLEDTLIKVITTWARSWESHDVDGYFAAYHPEFEPTYQDSLEEWHDDRARRVARPADLTITFDRFEITEATDDYVTVRFWLAYARPGYADDTWKEVRFRKKDGKWLIDIERNLRIETRN